MFIFKLFLCFLFSLCCSVYGKISDLDYGSIPRKFYTDNFDECNLLGKEALYCSFNYTLRPINPKTPPKEWDTIQALKLVKTNYDHARLYHGICVPLTCPNATDLYGSEPEFRAELTRCYDAKYESKGLRGDINNLHCQTAEPLPVDTADKLVAVAAACYLVFIAYATIVDTYLVPEGDAKRNSILRCFSLAANWGVLKQISNTPDSERLKAIHGVKVFSSWSVAACHGILGFMVGPLLNTQYFEKLPHRSFITLALIQAGTFTMQIFVLLSSVLFAFNICCTFKGDKKISLGHILLIFVARLLRIWPALFVVLLIHCTWLRHLGDGPFWDEVVGYESRVCRSGWWSNLLFVNSWLSPDKMCLQQTWYLNVDNLFTIISLLMIYVIWKNRDYVYIILGSVLAIFLSLLAYQMYSNNIEAAYTTEPEKILFTIEILSNTDHYILTQSIYTQGPAMVMGFGLGYFYYFNREKQYFTKKIHVVLWWIVFFLCAGIVFGISAWMISDNYFHDPLLATLIVCISRPLFCFGFAFLFFGVSQGVGWMVKWSLETTLTRILGRIGYSVYLINPLVAKLEIGLRRYPVYASDLALVHESICCIFMSVLLGLFLALLVEMPFTRLQIALFKETISPEVTLSKEAKNNTLTKL